MIVITALVVANVVVVVVVAVVAGVVGFTIIAVHHAVLSGAMPLLSL